MTDMEKALSSLKIGDIFHADSSSGAKLVCLVTDINNVFIIGKRITCLDYLQFDKTTGLLQNDGVAPGVVTVVAQLPHDIHEIMLQINQKYGGPVDPKRLVTDPASYRLTRSQIDALCFISDFCETHKICGVPDHA